MTELPTATLQWKGTATCIDFNCVCGEYTHFCVDMPFSGAVLCPHCQRTWALEDHVEVSPAVDPHLVEYAARVPRP